MILKIYGWYQKCWMEKYSCFSFSRIYSVGTSIHPTSNKPEKGCFLETTQLKRYSSKPSSIIWCLCTLCCYNSYFFLWFIVQQVGPKSTRQGNISAKTICYCCCWKTYAYGRQCWGACSGKSNFLLSNSLVSHVIMPLLSITVEPR